MPYKPVGTLQKLELMVLLVIEYLPIIELQFDSIACNSLLRDIYISFLIVRIAALCIIKSVDLLNERVLAYHHCCYTISFVFVLGLAFIVLCIYVYCIIMQNYFTKIVLRAIYIFKTIH